MVSDKPFRTFNLFFFEYDRTDGVMVSVLASSTVDSGFEPRSGETKDYKIGMCCLSAKHAALRSKSNDSLAWNQNNVSECSDMSTYGLLFQWASTKKGPTKSVGLEQSGTAELALSNNHSLTHSPLTHSLTLFIVSDKPFGTFKPLFFE